MVKSIKNISDKLRSDNQPNNIVSNNSKFFQEFRHKSKTKRANPYSRVNPFQNTKFYFRTESNPNVQKTQKAQEEIRKNLLEFLRSECDFHKQSVIVLTYLVEYQKALGDNVYISELIDLYKALSTKPFSELQKSIEADDGMQSLISCISNILKDKKLLAFIDRSAKQIKAIVLFDKVNNSLAKLIETKTVNCKENPNNNLSSIIRHTSNQEMLIKQIIDIYNKNGLTIPNEIIKLKLIYNYICKLTNQLLNHKHAEQITINDNKISANLKFHIPIILTASNLSLDNPITPAIRTEDFIAPRNTSSLFMLFKTNIINLFSSIEPNQQLNNTNSKPQFK